MILGIGSDITDIRRIEKVIERHGERFLNRIFTDTERARADRRTKSVETYAKRFAAKEAVLDFSNAPGHIAKLIPPGHEARIDVSITDEYPLAQAFVIISAVPAATRDA